MAEDDRKGYRDDLGAALEKAARLEEENRALRDELAKKNEPPKPPASVVQQDRSSALSLVGVGVVVSLALALIVALRGSSRSSTPTPMPIATMTAFVPPTPSFYLPAPFHLYDSMAASSAAPPTVGPEESYVEVRSSPSGALVERNGKALGKTPLFVRVSTKSSGPCSAGVCSGGGCEAGAVGCSAATCSGQTCPHGFVCRGEGTCSGGQCTGGSCEAATQVLLTLGPDRAKLALTADEPVVGHLFLR